MIATRTGWIAFDGIAPALRGGAMSVLALGLSAALSACTSRTLPLPPPNVDQVYPPNAQGLVLVEGSAQEGASVGIVNDRTMAGVIVTSQETDCSSVCPFRGEVEAEAGDQLRVWQFFETSSSRDVMVPE